ncbi:MAG: glycosyltransferase family 39 protein [Nitrospirae bacterium]|nr:glycosyltransferase family 39 protein [Nitrospirota bacterium]
MIPKSGFWSALLLGGLLFFYQLGAVPLFDLDEAIYAETGREMVETGDWLTPQFNYHPFFDKPILLYWVMAAAFKAFGLSEFSARAGSAVFGVGLLLVTYGLTLAVWNPRCGLIAMLILAGSLEMVVLAHAALTDMMLVFFITVALAGFYMLYTTRRGVWAIGLYLGAALAVLTKGPVGLVLPGLTIFLFILTAGPRLQLVRELRLGWGVPIFLVVAVPWYWFMIRMHGAAYVDSFFLKHNVERFTSVIGGHAGAPFYYAGILAVGFFPWVAFLPAALVSIFPGPTLSARWKNIGRIPSERPFDWFLLLWIFVVFGFFTLAGTKLPNYIAPAFPPLAVFTAGWWDRRMDERPSDPVRGYRFSFALLWLLTFGIALLLLAAPQGIEWARTRYAVSAPYLTQPIELDRILMFSAFILLIGVVTFRVLFRIVRRWAGFMILWLTTGIFAFVLLFGLIPSVSRYIQMPLRDLSTEAAGRVHPDEPLVLFGLKKPSVLFYARRGATVLKSNQEEDLRNVIATHPRAVVLSPIHLIPVLTAVPGLTIRDERGGYVLAANF